EAASRRCPRQSEQSELWKFRSTPTAYRRPDRAELVSCHRPFERGAWSCIHVNDAAGGGRGLGHARWLLLESRGANLGAGAEESSPVDVRFSGERRIRWIDELWRRCPRLRATTGNLH